MMSIRMVVAVIIAFSLMAGIASVVTKNTNIKKEQPKALQQKNDEKTHSEIKINEVVVEKDMNFKEIANPKNVQTITLAGGCFWCIEGAFQEKNGILSAISGYMGGTAENAQYKKVANGTTDHREVVQIIYDEAIISTQEVVNQFLKQIDPTDAKGQFADKGFQYSTAILYNTKEQKNIADNLIQKLKESNLFTQEIVVKVLSETEFYIAEEYHQDYYKKSAAHYQLYANASGRKGFIKDNWSKYAALEFFENTKR